MKYRVLLSQTKMALVQPKGHATDSRVGFEVHDHADSCLQPPPLATEGTGDDMKLVEVLNVRARGGYSSLDVDRRS